MHHSADAWAAQNCPGCALCAERSVGLGNARACAWGMRLARLMSAGLLKVQLAAALTGAYHPRALQHHQLKWMELHGAVRSGTEQHKS